MNYGQFDLWSFVTGFGVAVILEGIRLQFFA